MKRGNRVEVVLAFRGKGGILDGSVPPGGRLAILPLPFPMTRIGFSLLFSAFALSASLPLRAQMAPVPPVPSLAPKPGMTTETFESVVLSPTPAPGQSVPGWYPLMGPVYDGMNWMPGEVPPATFAAEQGVLRFRSNESSSGPSGRVRQLPDGTSEVCADLFFYEGALDYSQAGLVANASIESEVAQYGVTVGSWMGSFGSAPEGEVAEVPYERIYRVSGPGFSEEVQGTLANQWLRLSLQIDASRQVMTVKLNGEVIFSGYPKIIRRDIVDPEGPYEPLPFFANAGLVGGNNTVVSEPEGQNAPEESQIITEVFFDNFSHNGSSGAADLTVGPTRAGVTRIGDGVYSREAPKQSIRVNAKYDETATAFFGLQNEGSGAGSFTLRGGVARGSKIGVSNFLYQGGGKSNVTASLRAGTAEVSLGGGDNVVISSEASLKPNVRTQMSRLRGRYVNAGQSLSVSAVGGNSVLDAAKVDFRFESAIPATRRER